MSPIALSAGSPATAISLRTPGSLNVSVAVDLAQIARRLGDQGVAVGPCVLLQPAPQFSVLTAKGDEDPGRQDRQDGGEGHGDGQQDQETGSRPLRGDQTGSVEENPH